MTRAQFLNELYRRLGSMSKEQAEQHLTYYAEMLMDRMEEGMSEEEAVASLEDVDTIAGRILQEEGQAPAAPGPVLRAAEPQTPPAAAPAPPAGNWRKIAQIGLWTAAIVAVVLVAAGKLHNGNLPKPGISNKEMDRGSNTISSEGQVPHGDTADGIHIGPNGVEINDGVDSIRVGPNGVEINDGEDSFSIGPGGIGMNGSSWSDW